MNYRIIVPVLLSWAGKYRTPLAAAVFVLLLSVPFAFAPVRKMVGTEYRRVFSGNETPPPLIFQMSPESLDTPLGRIEERAKELERQVVELQQLRLKDLAEIRGLQTQFQEAMGEVAQANDLLEKQSEQLKTALKSVGSVQTGATSTEGENSSSESHKVNINTATLAQLDALPGIGPSYAQRIIDYRTAHGLFKSVNDLDKVEGIGPSTIEKLRDLVEV